MKVFLHIGLQKTGTTTLQADVFPNIPGVKFLGRRNGGIKGDRLYNLVCEFCFSPKKDNLLLKQIYNELNHLKTNYQKILLSEEWFLTGYDGIQMKSYINWVEKLNRLSICFKDYEKTIVISTRKPVDALFSVYCQNIQRRFPMNYGTFENFVNNSEDAKAYDVKNLEYVINEIFDCHPRVIKFLDIKNNRIDHIIFSIFDVETNFDKVEIGNKNSLKKYEQNSAIIKADTLLTFYLRKVARLLPNILKVKLKKYLQIDYTKILSLSLKSKVIKYPSKKLIKEIESRYGK